MFKHLMIRSSLLALLFTAGIALAQNSEGIRVSGTGTVWGAPDTAEFTVGINTLDADVSAATEESNAVADAIISAMLEAGVAESDVRTSSFNVYREDRRDDEGELLEPVFRVVNSVRVTVRDTAQVGELLSLALEGGANQVTALTFTIADPAELRAQARELAVQDARARAEQLAALTGVTLGVPVLIEEYSSGGVPSSESRNYAMTAQAASVPVQAGELSVSVNLNIVYSIDSE